MTCSRRKALWFCLTANSGSYSRAPTTSITFSSDSSISSSSALAQGHQYPKDAEVPFNHGPKLLRDERFMILLGATWQNSGDLLCSSAMKRGANKAVGRSGQQDCLATACGSIGRSLFACLPSAQVMDEHEGTNTRPLQDPAVVMRHNR